MTMFEDPNRQAVGLGPIWGDATRDNDPATPVVPGVEEDPAGHTIPAVREWVDANPDRADEVLEAELARGSAARTSLVEWLEGFIAHRDDE